MILGISSLGNTLMMVTRAMGMRVNHTITIPILAKQTMPFLQLVTNTASTFSSAHRMSRYSESLIWIRSRSHQQKTTRISYLFRSLGQMRLL
jgi:hypothetical protein